MSSPPGVDAGAAAARGRAPRRRGDAARRRGRSSVESARRTLLEQLRTQRPARVRPRRAPGGDVAPPARSSSTCATRRKPISRTSAPIAFRERRGLPARRSDDAPEPRGARGADGGRDGLAAARNRSDETAMGGRLLRAWLLRPLVALERIQDRLDAVEEFAFRSDRARPSCATRCKPSTTRAARRARRARHGRAARSRVAAAVDRGRAARADGARRAPGAAGPSLVARAGRPGRRPRCARLGR